MLDLCAPDSNGMIDLCYQILISSRSWQNKASESFPYDKGIRIHIFPETFIYVGHID